MTSVSDDKRNPLIAGLMRADAFEHSIQKLELLETHISWVILTGEYAYKIKKPVNFGFVDFSTLERRHHFCEEELRLNGRFTRDLYLAVKPIYGPHESPSFHGPGTPIEYAVQMRQFAHADLLPNAMSRSGAVEKGADPLASKWAAPFLTGPCLNLADQFDRLATRLAQFQATAPVAQSTDSFGSPVKIRDAMEANFLSLAKDSDQPSKIQPLKDWSTQEFARCEPEFIRRKNEGRVRDGHGDLHLGNMILRAGEIEIFDCIEFNPDLRWIDVISEVAFLVMDLTSRKKPELGWQFLNQWLIETGDYEALKVWSWYYCYRALVRAKVTALRRRQDDVETSEAAQLDSELENYFNLARQVIERPAPRLFITHGVSGSGKSYWSKQLTTDFGLIWLRSDVERKRRIGSGHSTAAASPNLYSAATTTETYERLASLAKTILENGWPVLIDATFLKRSQRDLFQALAQDLGIQPCLLTFEADTATLQARIRNRQSAHDNVSDATEAVLAQQLEAQDPISPDECWTIISSNASQADVKARLYRAVMPLIDGNDTH